MIKHASEQDPVSHGVVPREGFGEALTRAGLRLSTAEQQAVLDFADLRGDERLQRRECRGLFGGAEGPAHLSAGRCTLIRCPPPKLART